MVWEGLKDLGQIFARPNYDVPVTSLPMNQPVEPSQPQTPSATQTTDTIQVTPPVNPDALAPWDTFDNCRHNVRALCDLMGLTEQQKNDLSSTVHCESNYNPQCVHPNIVNGKTVSTDYGICQVNDFYHIGAGKDFPSSDYVLNNPEMCIRWMCKEWLAGNANMWVCHLRNLQVYYSS